MNPSSQPSLGKATWRLRVVLAGIALVTTACGSTSALDTASTSPPSTSTPSTTTGTPSTASESAVGAPESPREEIGTYAVGQRQVDLVDPSRPTAANGDAPASDQRALPTVVFYPAVGDPGADPLSPVVTEGAEPLDGPHPLVVFSHGVTGRGIFYQAVLRVWASAGYVVVAPDHPLSNADTPGGPTVTDVGNQPADVSFLIDAFTARADDATPAATPSGPPTVTPVDFDPDFDPDTATDPDRDSEPDPDADAEPEPDTEGALDPGPGLEAAAEVAELVDPDKIAATGHSLGGVTSLGVGYGLGLVDDRFDAVIDWAGLPLLLRDGPEPGITDRPALIVHGTDDGTVSYSQSEEAFAILESPRVFITLPGGEHVVPFVSPGSPAGELVTRTAVDFLDAHLKDDPEGIDRLVAAVDAAGEDLATLETADP
ncbi:hypothetical protein BH20ACT3_BH20ACT3_01860 [soil metagenome]